MIVDNIKNAKKYEMVSPRVRQALEFLQNTDFSGLTERTNFEIDGTDCYAFFEAGTQKPIEKCSWETHNIRGDIHYILDGEQKFGYVYRGNLKSSRGYDAQRDVEFHEGEGDFIILKPGMFIIVFPEDGHMPNIEPRSGEKIRKVVVKFTAE